MEEGVAAQERMVASAATALQDAQQRAGEAAATRARLGPIERAIGALEQRTRKRCARGRS